MDVKVSDQITTTSTDVGDDEESQDGLTCLQKWNQPLFKRKLAYTATLYLAIFMYGWIVAIKGPSLLDLQEITHTDTTGGATFFTSAAVGSVAGALVGGFIYDRFNKQLTIFFSQLLFALTCALIPYCTSYWSMVFLFFLNEFLIGGFKTGSNVEILHLWGDDSKRFMQGLHFCFSFGASVSPLILQPYLSKDSSHVYNQTYDGNDQINISSILTDSNRMVKVGSINRTSVSEVKHLPDDILLEDPETSQIHIPYIISGVLVAVSAIGLLIRYFHDKSKPVSVKTQMKETNNHPYYPRWTIIATLVLFLFLYFFLDEVEDSSPSFLATFVICGLGWNKIDGARVTSAFWAAFTVGRLVGTISISFLTHFQFFIICSCCLLVSQIGLMLSGLFHLNIGVWLSVILAGISIAVILPASLTWMEKEFVSVSGKIMSVIYVALSLGGMANPQLIGYMMQHVDFMGYCYILLAETILFVLTLAALKMFLEKVLRKYKPVKPALDQENGNYEPRLQSDECEDETTHVSQSDLRIH